MKRYSIAVIILLGAGMFLGAKPVEAACTNVPVGGNYAVSTSCQFSYTIDGVDTSTGNNTAVLTINTTKALTVGTGQTVIAGSIDLSAANVSINFVGTGKLNTGIEYHILATDSDGDGWPDSTTYSTSAGTRRGAYTSATYEDTWATTIDCGPNNASAKPGQTVYQAGSFTNAVNAALVYDWNCDGVETKAFTRVYTCNACTNGSGYASNQAALSGVANQDPVNTGFITSTPACNTAGTRYTISATTCQDPAVANCTAQATSNGAVTQTCI